MRLASVVASAALCIAANSYAVDAGTIIANARARMEATDARATGRLVRVDANGKRTSNAFRIQSHWFPGVLRTLLEISPAGAGAHDRNPSVGQNVSQGDGSDARLSILFETRPNGQDTIRVFRPHASQAVVLPFDRWKESVAGTGFDYEDLLQSEFYWREQTLVKSAKLGARECDVVKSIPGPSDHSQYAEVQTWFDHTTGYPIFVEKTMKDAGIVKDFTSFGLSHSGGVWSARQVEVKIQGRPGSTLLIFERGSTKANLSLKDFSPEQISRFEDHP